MVILTFTKSGNKATTPAKLDKAVFNVSVDNHELLKSAYITYLAKGRGNLAQTKKRGEVSGGGRKPWRQKGTGRARFGSSRNPIWRGGGIAFGPTGNENYIKKLPLRTKRQAIRQALSMAAQEGRISVIEDITVKSGKTKDANLLLAKIGVNTDALIVVETKSIELTRAIRNIAGVRLVQPQYLNVYDVINANHIVLSQSTLPIISQWLGEDK